jgi:uncharacterized membrane protein
MVGEAQIHIFHHWFLTHQILSIVRSQIEMIRTFSLIGMLTIFLKSHSQMTNLEKLIFVNKNWLTDPRVACKSASNLVKFIKKDLELEDELEQF